MAYEAEIRTDRTQKRSAKPITRLGHWQVAAFLRNAEHTYPYRCEIGVELKGDSVTLVVNHYNHNAEKPDKQVVLLRGVPFTALLHGEVVPRRTVSGYGAQLLPGEPDLSD